MLVGIFCGYKIIKYKRMWVKVIVNDSGYHLLYHNFTTLFAEHKSRMMS